MTRLRLVSSNPDGEGARASPPPRGAATSPTSTPRKSPRGAVPFSLAQRLDAGEAVVWWDGVDSMRWRAPLILATIGAAVFAAVSLAVPELWQQPTRELLRALGVCLAPALVQGMRNWMAQRTVVVTDTTVLDADRNGRGDGLRLRNIRVVRRDWITGGVIIEGAAHRVRIPPALVADVRHHIRRQRAVILMREDDAVDDRLGWLS